MRWGEAGLKPRTRSITSKGYAITHGFDAWIVYSGYRVATAPSQSEIDLAEKGAESVAPLYGDLPKTN